MSVPRIGRRPILARWGFQRENPLVVPKEGDGHIKASFIRLSLVCPSHESDKSDSCWMNYTSFPARKTWSGHTSSYLMNDTIICPPFLPNNSYKENSESLSAASFTSLGCPNALKRTNDSPLGPKPEPGVVTMKHFSKRESKTSQLFLPGNFTQT